MTKQPQNKNFMKSLLIKSKSLLCVTILAVIATVSTAHPALAATCNGVKTSVDFGCDPTTDPVSAIVVAVINFLAIGVGIAVVGGIVFGAIRYTSANGDASQSQQGIKIVVGAIIGLILFILMFAILNFLVPGGLFNTNKPMPVAQQESLADSIKRSIEEGKKAMQEPGGSNNASSSLAGACYDVKVSKADIATKDRFHRKSGQPYAFENSLEGIDYAAAHGYKAIDIDTMVTKDGVLVGTHAWEPLSSGIMGGFKDPQGKLKKDTRLSDMTLAEVRRLRHEDGYRISTLEELIVHAKSKGINLIIEMKVPAQIEKQLPQVAAILNANNVKAGVTSRKDKAGYVHALAVARSLGFNTRMASSPGATAKDRTWVSPNKDEALCSRLKG